MKKDELETIFKVVKIEDIKISIPDFEKLRDRILALSEPFFKE